MLKSKKISALLCLAVSVVAISLTACEAVQKEDSSEPAISSSTEVAVSSQNTDDSKTAVSKEPYTEEEQQQKKQELIDAINDLKEKENE